MSSRNTKLTVQTSVNNFMTQETKSGDSKNEMFLYQKTKIFMLKMIKLLS